MATIAEVIADKRARLAEIDAQIEVALGHLAVGLGDLGAPVSVRLDRVLGSRETLGTLARRRGEYVEVIEALETYATFVGGAE